MDLFTNLADATLRIKCGSSSGSGFYFLKPDIVITNYHVVGNNRVNQPGIVGIAENGQNVNLDLIAFSPEDDSDYAILKVSGQSPKRQHVLLPKIPNPQPRGTKVLFSGFPHGIAHLLIQQAIVAGNLDEEKFYIDGSVNGGNSGGPIVDFSDGKIIGIVTQRRFIFANKTDWDQIATTAKELREHYQTISASGGGAFLMGIDFVKFSAVMAEAMSLLQKVVESNANTGIGIGYSIKAVLEKCTELNIS
ncbi:MAG: trypsin-like peptidase domain-containing protein [Anaerolineae bacterium]|nr:trypsin-like peptidase domain-containing protein [Anaerolineae bacterium]